MHKILNQLEALKSKMQQGAERQPEAYEQMMLALISEMEEKDQLLSTWGKEAKGSHAVLSAWKDYLEDFCEICLSWAEQPFEIIKGKHFYEEMEDLMAELDDWIESLQEEGILENELSYMEAWDIGVFFETKA